MKQIIAWLVFSLFLSCHNTPMEPKSDELPNVGIPSMVQESFRNREPMRFDGVFNLDRTQRAVGELVAILDVPSGNHRYWDMPQGSFYPSYKGGCINQKVTWGNTLEIYVVVDPE